MRPPRIFIIAAFVVTATVLLVVSVRRGDRQRHALGDDAGSTHSTARSVGSLAFAFFHTPFSLFPPNAIISLTDDNTTSFLARPAGFGPPLPPKGLSGQLWIGSGFSDDSIRNGVVAGGAEGELGCSDVPGWVDGNVKVAAEAVVATDGKGSSKSNHHKRSAADRAMGGEGLMWRPETFEPTEDGTDDHYRAPWQKSKQTTPKELPNAKSDHADIQSIQEGAEIAGKVVLLSRGGCGFLEKVEWVQRRGGIALIVGDNTRGGPLIQMYARGDTSNVTIPAVFTSRTTAHLLSSLMGPNKLMEESVDVNGKPVTKVQSPKPKDGKKKSAPKIATPTPTPRPSPTPQAKLKSTSDDKPEKESWVWSLFSGSKSSGSASDSRRPPSSGRLDWVLLDDWNEDDEKKPEKSTSTAAKDAQKTRTGSARDDFVIGVQDWRDPDLLAEPSKDTKQNNKNDKGKSTGKPKTNQDLKGGSITPGSGEYSAGAAAADQVPAKESPEKGAGLLYNFFGDDEAEVIADFGVPGKSMAGESDDAQLEHEGLWVTLTQVSGATPFFDTLLVLVVSPLVTLTVVYALLLLRSRIRRRRWRAPKSVVERLPVRTYHTVASTGSSSPRLPSPPGSSPNTPLLQPGRSRQRSQTISGPPEPARKSNEHEKGASVSSEWKKFMGRQVECVVCLEEYVDGVSRVMSLPCGHEFHVDCITPWLTTRRRTCPICKGDVVRSLARGSTSGSGSRYEADHDDSDENIQVQAAETINTSPTSALPISGSLQDDSEDLEQGFIGSTSPTRPPLAGLSSTASASWRLLASSFGSTRSNEEHRRR